MLSYILSVAFISMYCSAHETSALKPSYLPIPHIYSQLVPFYKAQLFMFWNKYSNTSPILVPTQIHLSCCETSTAFIIHMKPYPYETYLRVASHDSCFKNVNFLTIRLYAFQIRNQTLILCYAYAEFYIFDTELPASLDSQKQTCSTWKILSHCLFKALLWNKQLRIWELAIHLCPHHYLRVSSWVCNERHPLRHEE